MKWDSERVRQLCIDEDFYTCGNNAEYSEMLDFVDTHEPTKGNVIVVANNIFCHSNIEDLMEAHELDDKKDVFMMILNYMTRDVVYMYFDTQQ